MSVRITLSCTDLCTLLLKQPLEKGNMSFKAQQMAIWVISHVHSSGSVAGFWTEQAQEEICSQVWSTAASSDPINDGMRDRGACGFSRVHSFLLQTTEGCRQLCFVKDVFNSHTCMLFPAQRERFGVDTMKRDTQCNRVTTMQQRGQHLIAGQN